MESKTDYKIKTLATKEVYGSEIQINKNIHNKFASIPFDYNAKAMLKS